jgi:hypothetical protein
MIFIIFHVRVKNILLLKTPHEECLYELVHLLYGGNNRQYFIFY